VRAAREEQVVALDVSEVDGIGRQHWAEAGVAGRIDLRIGPALETLAALLAGGEAGEFDFAFVDAHKPEYDGYYEACLKLVRVGGLIVFDNMLQAGKVVDPSTSDEGVMAIRALNAKIAVDDRVKPCCCRR
jgi:predicted O-methyltransferase YrrM